VDQLAAQHRRGAQDVIRDNLMPGLPQRPRKRPDPAQASRTRPRRIPLLASKERISGEPRLAAHVPNRAEHITSPRNPGCPTQRHTDE
jgi:hypothetical protein